MIVYKALKHGLSPYRNFKWPLPKGKRKGVWIAEPGTPVLCQRGFHGFLRLEDAEKAGYEVYEMELSGPIVKDHEKAAGTRARLVRKLWQFGPEGPISKGVLKCIRCRKPHDSYIVQKGVAPSWVDLTDGHSYSPETFEHYAARQKTIAARIGAYRLARKAAQADDKTRPGTTYSPVVPAYHAFKDWPAEPKRCATCGLTKDLHTGWQERAKVADEFHDYDRWELLLVIQELSAA